MRTLQAAPVIELILDKAQLETSVTGIKPFVILPNHFESNYTGRFYTGLGVSIERLLEAEIRWHTPPPDEVFLSQIQNSFAKLAHVPTNNLIAGNVSTWPEGFGDWDGDGELHSSALVRLDWEFFVREESLLLQLRASNEDNPKTVARIVLSNLTENVLLAEFETDVANPVRFAEVLLLPGNKYSLSGSGVIEEGDFGNPVGGFQFEFQNAIFLVLPPQATVEPQNQTINSGEAAALSVIASGTGPFIYQWYRGPSGDLNNIINGATNVSYTTPALTENASYWVQVSNGVDVTNTATAAVTLRVPPSITQQPANQSVTSGESATLDVIVSGTAPFTYQWYSGASGNTNEPIIGATSATYMTQPITANASYWVQVRNGAGATNSSNAVVEVIQLPVGQWPGSGGRDVVASGNYAFLVGDAFDVIDVRDPVNPVRVGGLNIGGRAITLLGHYAYVASSAGLGIIDISNPSNPSLAETWDTGPTADIIILGQLAYLTGTNSLQIYDLSNPTQPTFLGIYVETPGSDAGFDSIAITERHAFVADLRFGGFRVIDVTNPSNPVKVGEYSGLIWTADLAISGPYLFVADGYDHLPIFDISQPNNPVLIGRDDTSGFAESVKVLGTRAYVASSDGGGFRVVNVSDPANPRLLQRYNVSGLGGDATGASIPSNYAYTALHGLAIFQIDEANVPPQLSMYPSAPRIDAGQQAKLTVMATGTAPFTYQWFAGPSGDVTRPVVGANSATLTTASLLSATSFWVRVTNPAAIVDSPAIHVSVTAPVAADQLQNASFEVPMTPANTPFSVVPEAWSGNRIMVIRGDYSPGYPLPADGQQYAVLDASSTLSQAFAASASGTYTLTWVDSSEFNGPGGEVFYRVSISDALGNTLTTQHLNGSALALREWNQRSMDVSLTPGTYLVQFDGLAGAFSGKPLIDNITLVPPQGIPPSIARQPQGLSIVRGQPASITVSAQGSQPLAYQWYLGPSGVITNPISGASGSAYALPEDAQTGQYWVHVSNPFGIINSEAALVTVVEPPAITQQPQSHSILRGETTSLQVSLTETVPLTYRWYAGLQGDTNNPVPGGTAPILFLPTLTASTAFWVRVVFGSDFIDSETAFVNVLVPPAITLQPQSLAILPGERVTLTVAATSHLPMTFQWFESRPEGNTPIAGAQSLSFFTPPLTSSTRYFVRVSNSETQVDSATAIISVATAPLITKHPQPLTVRVGETATLSITALGLEPLTYQWRRNGYLLHGAATGSALTFPAVTLLDAGEYVVEVANASGRTLSEPATINVLVPPVITAHPQSTQLTVGTGQPLQLEVAATGTVPFSYTWFKNDRRLPEENGPRLAISAPSLSDSGVYMVIVSNITGATLSAPAVVTTLQPASISTQPHSQTGALGSRVVFTVTAAGTLPFQYQWRHNGAIIPGETSDTYTIPFLTLAQAGIYTVSIANSAGATLSKPAELVVELPPQPAGDLFAGRIPLNPDGTGSISSTNSFATREQDEPRHAGKPGAQSIWFTWKAPASGQAIFNTVGSAFDTLLAIYTGSSLSTLSETVSDDDHGNSFTSEVKFNAAKDEIYIIAVDGFGSSTGRLALSWELANIPSAVPVITEHPQSRTVLQGSSVNLQVAAQNAPDPQSYQWFFRGRPLPGAIGQNLLLPNISPDDVGVYEVHVTAGGVTVRSLEAVIAIGPDPAFRSFDKLEELGEAVPPPGGQLLAAGSSQSTRILSATASPPPILAVSAGIPVTYIINNETATTQQGENGPCSVIAYGSLWIGIKAESAGTLLVETPGAAFDVAIGIYEFPEIGRSPILCAVSEPLMLPVEAGGILFVGADGANGKTGNIPLRVRLGHPPVPVLPPETENLAHGEQRRLLAETTPSGSAPDYRWHLNGTPIPGAGSPEFNLIGGVSPAGEYSVVISNPLGRVTNVIARIDMAPSVQVEEEDAPAFENGRFRFGFHGNPFQQIKIDRSGALNLNGSDWTTAGRVWLSSNGTGTFADPITNLSSRFYRVNNAPVEIVETAEITWRDKPFWSLKFSGGRIGQRYFLEARSSPGVPWTIIKTNTVTELDWKVEVPKSDPGQVYQVRSEN